LEIQKPVIQRLLSLIRFRNEYPAFNGEFSVGDTPASKIELSWLTDEKSCTLHIDLNSCKALVTYQDMEGNTQNYII